MTDPAPKKSESALREEAVLAMWLKNKVFQATLDKPAPRGEYVFYDGPPFATGLPHYGHILQSAVKDAVPRYKTMRGYRVERQWGWDCHGLPIENIVEKELGTKSKKDILALGVKKFNDLCRERIFTFTKEWERIIPRIGRWADMENPYRTMDFDYMQSEWWAFKSLYEKGLIYEDYRSMHICPRCETTLSQGEVAEGYKDIKDLSMTVKFELIGHPGTYFLAWTTTPWTLAGNVALAVGPDITYVQVKTEKGNFILAKDLVGKVLGDLAYEIVNEQKGSECVGATYVPVFDSYFKNEKLKNHENGWKVYAADFVTTDTGTGIVHIAPAFGADDMMLGKSANLPFVQHVGIDGVIKPEVAELAGQSVSPRAKNNPEDVREIDLTVKKVLGDKVFSTEKFLHSYPHCWRCDTALLNYATSSWFVAVEKVKPTLLETAKKIHWAPDHIKEGRFGDWLKGARDWSISRQRFWANTIPVWRCEKCKKEKVFGSAAELTAASGAPVTDLHKEFVDEVSFSCDCGATMQRVPDVLDTWFDSGSVPFAMLGFPEQNKEAFQKRMPADFIAEAQDQCRAWFYYQHVLAGSLFGTEAFKNCIVTGIVLAEDGKKMSKKLKNYPDPMDIVDKYGADTMRLYMLSSPVVKTEALRFSEKEVGQLASKVIGRLNNVLAFYQLYADGTERDNKSTNILDLWILARTHELIAETTNAFENYQLDVAARPIIDFVDDLSVWYLRRSRDRFKEEGEDKKTALATMRYVLHTLSRVMAPMTPFYAEHLFQAVRESEDESSVHLATWPNYEDAPQNTDIVQAMRLVRGVVTLALEARAKANLPVRQPLATLFVNVDAIVANPELVSLISDEVNVKQIAKGKEVSLDTTLTDALKEEGMAREIIRTIQDARKKSGKKPGEVVRVALTAPAAFITALKNHEAAIRAAVSAETIESAEGEAIGAVIQ